MITFSTLDYEEAMQSLKKVSQDRKAEFALVAKLALDHNDEIVRCEVVDIAANYDDPELLWIPAQCLVDDSEIVQFHAIQAYVDLEVAKIRNMLQKQVGEESKLSSRVCAYANLYRLTNNPKYLLELERFLLDKDTDYHCLYIALQLFVEKHYMMHMPVIHLFRNILKKAINLPEGLKSDLLKELPNDEPN